MSQISVTGNTNKVFLLRVCYCLHEQYVRPLAELSAMLMLRLAQMCDKQMHHYAACGHQVFYQYLKCGAARNRPNAEPCVPATGNQRDLPQKLDVQDRNKPGKCPPCNGHTPHSSQGSQF